MKRGGAIFTGIPRALGANVCDLAGTAKWHQGSVFLCFCNCKLFATSYNVPARQENDPPMLERMAFKRPSATNIGWRRERGRPSLSEVFGSVRTRPTGSYFRKLLAFLGPGYLVAVGYMDPGNWATSLAGGSKFGYALLSVALLSNLMAILLQALCARLGIGAGRHLAQPCRAAFPRAVS